METDRFNVFDFSLEFFVFCLILDVFRAGSYADGVRFWRLQSCRNRGWLVRRLGGGARGRVSGHDGWCERRRETPTAGSVEVYWRHYSDCCSVTYRWIQTFVHIAATRPSLHAKLTSITCYSCTPGGIATPVYDFHNISLCFPRRKPTSRGNPTIPTHSLNQ